VDKLAYSIIFGLISSFLFPLTNILDKKGIKHFNPLLFAIIKVFFNIIFLLFIIYFTSKVPILLIYSTLKSYLIYILLGLISFSLSYLAFLELIKSKYLIKIQALFSFFSLVISLFVGFFFFHDKLNPIILFSLILIIFGISLINNLDLKITKILNKKEWFLFLIMSIGFNYYPIYTTYFSKEFNNSILGILIGEGTTFVSFLSILLFFLFKKKNYKKELKQLKTTKLKYPFLSSFFLTTAFIFLFTGTSKGYYSITLILSNLSLLWLSLFAHFFLKEKLNLKQYLGVLSLIVGLMIIKTLKI